MKNVSLSDPRRKKMRLFQIIFSFLTMAFFDMQDVFFLLLIKRFYLVFI